MAQKNANDLIARTLGQFLNGISYVAGVLIGVFFAVVLDVNIELYYLQNLAMESWPNVDPRHRFAYIPIFFILILIFGGTLNLVVAGNCRRLKFWWAWLVVGISHTIPVFALPLSNLMHFVPSFVLCVISMMINLFFLYWKFGEKIY